METYRDLNDYEIMYMVEENDEVKDLLFEKYRPIIINMANKYREEGKKLGLELDDLIQEGYFGLYSAIKNYNQDESALFYTYAIISIKSKILNAIKKYSTYKHKSLNQSLSLSQPIFNSQDSTIIDFVVDDNVSSPDIIVEEYEIQSIIKSYLFSLDIQNASIFELSLNGYTNVDISKLLDLSLKVVSNTLFSIRKRIVKYLA